VRSKGSLISLVVYRVLAIMLLYMAVMSLILYREISSTMILLRDEVLAEHALALGSYLERDQHNKLVLHMPRDERNSYALDGKHDQYVVRDATGAAIFHSPVIFDDIRPDNWPAEHTSNSFVTRDSSGATYFGKSTTYRFEGKPYLIEVLWSKDVADDFASDLISKFLYNVALAGVPLLLLVLGTLVYAIRLGLLPVIKVSGQAAAVSFATPGMRLEESGLPTEIRPLAVAVNKALERMEQGIILQKDFTAHAAHELRTPLAILRAHVDLLGNSDVVRTLKDDLETMNRLVSQLLSAARLEFPDGLPMERMDLAVVVRQVCAALWPMMMSAGLELDVSGVEKRMWIQGNYDSIYGSLRNLLENTLRYVPKGTTVNVDLDGGCVSVGDHGPGIPDEAKEKIFERFWRLDPRKKSGSGIGLFIVRRTMELHGGRVRVKDAPGGGSIFTLDFPLSDNTRPPQTA
jgi:signal transduction histidine kinase